MRAMPVPLVRLTGLLLTAAVACVSAPPPRSAPRPPAATSAPAASAPAAAPGSPPAPGQAAATAPAAPAPTPAAAATATPASPVHPLRASVPAFGGTMEIEVRDLPREAADAAIQAAAVEVGEVERLTDSGRPGGELALLN